FKMASKGFMLRSGAAKGADQAFYRGLVEYRQKAAQIDRSLASIYLPYDGFEKFYSNDKSGDFHLFSNFQTGEVARHIASKLHPAWDRCSDFAKDAHSRNVFQVLGDTLRHPSRILICWAPIQGKGVKGGTATAYRLATELGVRAEN